MSSVKNLQRMEKDALGELPLPLSALYGIQTRRSLDNFNLAGRPVHPALIHAYGQVKEACALTNLDLNYLTDLPQAEAITRACREVAEGLHDDQIPVDSLQGGAGTSLNMNINEVIANRSLQLLQKKPGDYAFVSPLADINLHQSTNDTFPTALKLAAIQMIQKLEKQIINLQEAFQEKEKYFSHIVKVGRTQMQDAVLTTLGREMSSYAEVLSRDRWRIYKCEERLRVVNLGGTAIGSGLAAPRKYIFQVVDKLRELTGIGFARAENLTDCTQNADVFVEVSGILKALASSLIKISSDLRLLSSGPQAGFGELILPRIQAGSSIMPGKVNPVIPEAVTQAALLVMGNDSVIAHAASMGSLELNPFMPLIAQALLENIDLLLKSCNLLCSKCVSGLEANEDRCRKQLKSSTAIATALVETLGYHEVEAIIIRAAKEKSDIYDCVLGTGLLSKKDLDALLSPEAVCRLGSPGK